MITDTTPNRQYQLPNEANNISDDVFRIIAALGAVDLDVANLLLAVASKAPSEHEHPLAAINGLIAVLASKQDHSAKGVANGYAALNSAGKVPTAQLPDTVFGALSYQGSWNASSNVPAIATAASANKGSYYIVSTNGATNISGITDWKTGDWIVSNGASWDKVDNTDAVSLVAGLSGVITVSALQVALGLKSAAYAEASAFATAAQFDALSTGKQDNLGFEPVSKLGGTGLGGYSATPKPATGSITLSAATGCYRSITKNGNISITAPTGSEGDSYLLVITNGATAGAVTFVGMTVFGDTIGNVSGAKYWVSIVRIGSDCAAFVTEKP